MSKISKRLNDYQTQMSIYAEQHKIILASDVLDMIEQLQEDLKDDVEKVAAELEDLEEDFCQCFRKCEEQCFIQRVTDIVRKGGVE